MSDLFDRVPVTVESLRLLGPMWRIEYVTESADGLAAVRLPSAYQAASFAEVIGTELVRLALPITDLTSPVILYVTLDAA